VDVRASDATDGVIALADRSLDGIRHPSKGVAMRIPEHGWSKDRIFATLEGFRARDMPWRDGRTWAYVYDPGPEAEEVLKRAFTMYLSENALDPTVFPSTLALETQVVAMAAAHLKGDDEVVGSFTSGGTESIILAVKTARDHARATRPDVREPEIVLPETAHAAFQKACHYLDVTPVIVPVDRTFRADVDAVRRAIGPRTVLLVGSAISYAHGVVDPIGALGALALEHGLLLHVDACMGGFLLPYFRRLGAPVPPFELDVPGVTSISMDLHKYAFAAKGASILLHRSKALRRHQMYACANWSGYTIINPTVQSTKSAGPVAAAWAVLHFIGDDGYLEIARQVLDATRRIAAGIRAVPGLALLAEPDMNLVAFTTTDDTNVFTIVDEMKARGWYVQPQLRFGQSKENIHLSINPASVRWVDAMLADLRACTEIARTRGTDGGAMREAIAGLDLGSLAPEQLGGLLATVGVDGARLPDRMAEINGILNVLPPAIREKLLVEFLNDLYRHRGE
jgi:glutamate/tyrosine decarboxylase-like PLP-dependent enzyme